MDNQLKKQRLTHYSASMIGGFMGGYAIINFCELFANAQTANMIHLVEKLIGRDFAGLVYILAAFLTYISGNVFCVLYRKFINKNLRAISIVFDFFAITAVGIITKFTSINFALLPILFAMPVQWNAFNDDAGYVSSTIFSTNNLRQAAMSLTQYLTDKDKARLDKTKFYWTTLLSFHIGVAVVCIASVLYGVQSIWFGYISVALTSAVYFRRYELSAKLRTKKHRHKNDTFKSA